jgi:hypothetical protein
VYKSSSSRLPYYRLLPFFLVIRLVTLLTVRVFSTRIYYLLQVLHFVSVLIASYRQPISFYTNTIL